MSTNEARQQLVTVPGAIIIGCTILAIGYFMTQRSNQPVQPDVNTPRVPTVNMKPITSADHIFGNPNAAIKVVEYSDPSCPYCKLFNPTMQQIMQNYGADGKVAWVYRSFPLDTPNANGQVLHPNAGRQAQAMECAAFIGGNDKFWAFENKWYDTFPLQGATDRSVVDDNAELAKIAKDVGLNAQSFNDCLSSGQLKSKVDAQYTDGINAGIAGTPSNIIVTASGTKIPLTGNNGGAIAYQNLKNIIDTLLTDVK